MLFDKKFEDHSKKLEMELSTSTAEADVDIKVKVRQRGNKRSSITKTISFIEANTPQTQADLMMFINKLEGLLDTIKGFDNEIEFYMLQKNLWTDEDYKKQSSLCENYVDKILVVLANLKTSLKSLTTPSSEIANPKVKLPHVELPTFSGESENFEKFLTSFEAYINKYNYTSFEKYGYLLRQVSGPAHEIIESVDINGTEYETARSLLVNFFSDKTQQIYCVIDKMVNLKFDPKNPYHWFSETKSLVAQMNRLQIDGDLFAQYFIWKSLGDKYKNVYIGIVNKSKPSLNEILENSCEMINRIGETKNVNSISGNDPKISNTVKDVKNTVALVTDINKDKRVKVSYYNGCWLCQLTESNDWENHKIWSCPKFKTPQHKFNKIKELKGCTKCGKPFHFYKNCKTKFSHKCGKCNNFHAEFLCLKRQITPNDETKEKLPVKKAPQNKEVKVNVNPIELEHVSNVDEILEVNCMFTKNPQNIIVPTFSALIGNESARIIYDTASMSTFIALGSLKRFEYVVLEKSVVIKVNGFNSSQLYRTFVVQLMLKINSKIHNIQAIVVPEIKSKIGNQNLNCIVNKFKDHNFALADKLLGEREDVDILLGINELYVLPVHSCSFGRKNYLSLLYYTSLGFMLGGDMTVLQSNIKYLNLLDKYVECFNDLGKYIKKDENI